MTEFIRDELTEDGQSVTRDDVIAEPKGHGDAAPDLGSTRPTSARRHPLSAVSQGRTQHDPCRRRDNFYSDRNRSWGVEVLPPRQLPRQERGSLARHQHPVPPDPGRQRGIMSDTDLRDIEALDARKSDGIAVVTGASRGIGAAIASRLGAEGYTVAVHYRQDSAAAADVVEKITAAGGTAFSFAADLAEPDTGTAFWASYDAAAGALRDAPVQVLVNNAAIIVNAAIEDTAAEDFIRQQHVNSTAPFLIIKAALPRLADGGRVVNVSSGATRVPIPGIIGYTMTKGALEALTLPLAQHLGPRGITVNAVRPGTTDTDMNADWLRGNSEAAANLVAQRALRRMGGPADVGDVVALLASHDARWITGQIIDATGGERL
ncbi:SDR family oxidoreductase [Streptomyces sp900116325]|uniref:SDR family NAD(P)-dependent oxidoreductase n=1 Tax=Streptomyces sp. 900116325 TaxID=3154295 RepID=UPI0033A64399